MLGRTWGLGAEGIKEPGTHWAASTAGCGQEGLGQVPGKTVWEIPGLLAKRLPCSATLGAPCPRTAV